MGPHHQQTSPGHLMITEKILLHINLIDRQLVSWASFKLGAVGNDCFWTDTHMQKSWATIGSGPSWMGLCWKWTGLVSQTFSVPLICCGRQDKKWQPCVDWSFSLALGRAYDPPFTPRTAWQLSLDRIWLKIKWCTKACPICGGKCVHEGEQSAAGNCHERRQSGLRLWHIKQVVSVHSAHPIIWEIIHLENLQTFGSQ